METFSASLAIWAGNSPVPGEFSAQGPVTRSFDVFFDLRLNKRLSKQSWGWWFETLSRPLWRHCNATDKITGKHRLKCPSIGHVIVAIISMGTIQLLYIFKSPCKSVKDRAFADEIYDILNNGQWGRKYSSEGNFTSSACDIDIYPLLSADSCFWLVNNREI